MRGHAENEREKEPAAGAIRFQFWCASRGQTVGNERRNATGAYGYRGRRRPSEAVGACQSRPCVRFLRRALLLALGFLAALPLPLPPVLGAMVGCSEVEVGGRGSHERGLGERNGARSRSSADPRPLEPAGYLLRDGS